MRNFIFLLLLLTCSSAFSQLSNRATSKSKADKFSMGIILSPAVSWLDVEHIDLSTDGATITGSFGFAAEYSANRLLSVVTGLNFNTLGGYLFDNESLQNTATKQNFRTNYTAMEIPLLLRINTLPINNTIYYTQGGFSSAFRLTATDYYRAATFEDPNFKNKITELSKPIFLHFMAGFGAKFNTSNRYSLFAEVNYKKSLINMASETGYADSGRYPASATPEILSGNMVFSVGVLF